MEHAMRGWVGGVVSALAASVVVAVLAAGCSSSTTPFDAGTGTDATVVSCGTKSALCGDTCVSLQNDNANCGACGTACTTGQVCSQGKCGTTCGGGTKLCGSSCVETDVDPANCGACGTKCSASEVCSAGKCGTTCAGGQTLCGGDGGASYCANTQSDNANCGGCGTTCGTGQVCQQGVCSNACAASDGGVQTLCAPDGGTTYCANTTSDNANCGACGVTCGSGQVCQNGACSNGCAASDGGVQSLCVPDGGSPYCANTVNDSANCGSCGNACGTGKTCVGGACVQQNVLTVPITQSMMIGASYTSCSTALPEFAGGSSNLGSCPNGSAGFTWTDTLGKMPTSIALTVNPTWSCDGNGTLTVTLNGTNVGTIQSTGFGCACNPGTNIRSTTLTSVTPYVVSGTNTIKFSTIGAGCEAYDANAAWNNLYGFVELTY